MNLGLGQEMVACAGHHGSERQKENVSGIKCSGKSYKYTQHIKECEERKTVRGA